MNQETKRLRNSFANKLSLLVFDHEFKTIPLTSIETNLIKELQTNIEELIILLKGEQ